MPADYLLPGLDANFGGLMFANFVCVVVYAILMFCMLHAVMENTKRTNALLAQLISFQQRSPEPKSTNSLPPPPPPIPTPFPTSLPLQKPGTGAPLKWEENA